MSALGILGYALYLAGEPTEAAERAVAAIRAPEAPDQPHAIARSLGTLALLAYDEGRNDDALAKADEAVEFARQHGLAASASMHVAHIARSRALLRAGRPAEAEAAADLAERLCRMPDPTVPYAFASIALAEVMIERGRLTSAKETLDRVAGEIAAFVDAGRMPRVLASARRKLRSAVRSHDVSIEALSPAEIAVIRLLASDLSQREVGRRLFLSVNTVKTHTRSIYRKLGVTSRAEAVARANALGLVT